jgi:hypothetical protein
MNSETSSAASSPAAPPHDWKWLRFPYRKIAASRLLEGLLARFVWLAVPLEYYVLIQFPGGIPYFGFLAAALAALLALVLVLLLSLVFALVPLPRGSSYEDRARALSVSLVISWTISLLLLAISYRLSHAIGIADDLVAYVVRLQFDIYKNYPHILDPVTLSVYLIYALIGGVLVKWVAARFGTEATRPTARDPMFLLIALLTAIIMMVIHGASRLT